MVNLKLVKLQYPVKNIGLFLEDWITLNDSFKVYESFRVISPNFNTKTSLKSFSIGKLPLNNYYEASEKLRLLTIDNLLAHWWAITIIHVFQNKQKWLFHQKRHFVKLKKLQIGNSRYCCVLLDQFSIAVIYYWVNSTVKNLKELFDSWLDKLLSERKIKSFYLKIIINFKNIPVNFTHIQS